MCGKHYRHQCDDGLYSIQHVIVPEILWIYQRCVHLECKAYASSILAQLFKFQIISSTHNGARNNSSFEESRCLVLMNILKSLQADLLSLTFALDVNNLTGNQAFWTNSLANFTHHLRMHIALEWNTFFAMVLHSGFRRTPLTYDWSKLDNPAAGHESRITWLKGDEKPSKDFTWARCFTARFHINNVKTFSWA